MVRKLKKILIISAYPNSYSTKRLVAEIEERKDKIEGITIEPEVIKATDLYAFISQNHKEKDLILIKDADKSKVFDSTNYIAVIPRIAGMSTFDFGAQIIQHLNENLNLFSTSTEIGLKICSNKFKNAQFLSRRGLRVPKQILTHHPTDYKELFEMIGGLPAVAKLQRGSQGQGVFLLNDELAASTALRSMENFGVDIILQQMINSGDTANDIRVFVIGAETKDPKVFAFKRYSVADDFRSNYSLSGIGEKVEITDTEKRMSIRASKSMKLGICGVDIMRDVDDHNLPYIIETNGTPSLKGVEKITEENVAGAIIDYVLENYENGGYKYMQQRISSLIDFVEMCSGAQVVGSRECLGVRDSQLDILNQIAGIIEDENYQLP